MKDCPGSVVAVDDDERVRQWVAGSARAVGKLDAAFLKINETIEGSFTRPVFRAFSSWRLYTNTVR